MMNSEIKFNSLVKRLKETYRKQSLYNFIIYFVKSLNIISIVFLLFTLVEYFINGSIELRTKLFYSFIGLSLITVIATIIIYKLKHKNNESEIIIST